jgi:phospholipid/cholesterol/gamma-HCH transport system substrate-binding protein
MISPLKHWKLGLLTALGVAAIGVIMILLGLRAREADTYHTYFDESVQGLEVGAVVKFRGVRIGKVDSIGIAPDHAMIDVALAIETEHARKLGLPDTAPSLRARLVIFGITGVKLIDMDFADATMPPPPTLAFTPGPRYIPSRQSLIGSLERGVLAATERLPVALDKAVVAMNDISQLARDARQVVPASLATLRTLERLTRSLDRSKVGASVARTLDSLAEVSERTTDASGELEQTIREMGEAARSLRDFVDALEREPDMLVKGRAKRR